MKTLGLGIKNREVDQQNRIKDQNINPHTYEYMTFFTKKLKLCNGKNKESSANGVGITRCHHVKNENRSISILMHKTQVQMD